MRKPIWIAVALLSLTVVWMSPALAVDSFFDVFTPPVISGPPYPTDSAGLNVARFLGGILQLDGTEFVALNLARDNVSMLDLAVNLTASDGMAGVGNFNIDSFFDITAADTVNTSWTVDSFFDIAFVFNGGGGTWGTLVVRNPGFPPGDPKRFFDVFSVDSFFDIMYTVDFGIGIQHEITAHGTVPVGVQLMNVSINNTSSSNCGCDSFFDIFVDIHVTQQPLAGEPILSIHQTGLYVDNPIQVRYPSWGGLKSMYR